MNKSKFLYIGTTDRMEKDIVPKLGIPYVGLEVVGLNRKNIFKNIEVLKKFKKAIDYMNEYGQVKVEEKVVTKGAVEKEVDGR